MAWCKKYYLRGCSSDCNPLEKKPILFIPPGLCLRLLISGYHQVSDAYLKIIMSEQEHCHGSAIKITQSLAKS